MNNEEDFKKWLESQSDSYFSKPLAFKINSIDSIKSKNEKYEFFKDCKELFDFFFKRPVTFCNKTKCIIDEDGNRILDLDLKGKFQYFNTEEKTNKIGLFITQLINNEFLPYSEKQENKEKQ